MKSYQIAAAVLTALTATAAQAQEIKSKTMCIPTTAYEGQVEIIEMCDLSEVNKNNNFQLTTGGCAVSGQTVYDSVSKSDTAIYDQIAYTVWGTENELKAQAIPVCNEYSAAPYSVEL